MERKSRGRPAHQATDVNRGKVQALSQAGYTLEDIGGYLDIDAKTLRKHYGRELTFAGMELIAGAVQNLGRAALGAKAQFDDNGNRLRDEVKPEAWAICFLLKTKGKQLGFSERLEHTGAGGADLFAGLDLSKLSDGRLKLLKDILRDAGVGLED